MITGLPPEVPSFTVVRSLWTTGVVVRSTIVPPEIREAPLLATFENKISIDPVISPEFGIVIDPV
jgi:hypothetical protein